MHYLSNKGFSLIELMVVLAIVGILTAIAVPTYHDYVKRARYSEIVMSTAPYKLGVSLCYQTNGSLTHCQAGSEDIPKAITTSNNESQKLINTISVSKGVIKVTPKNVNGFTSKDTYILTPTADDHQLMWQASGGAIEAGYAK